MPTGGSEGESMNRDVAKECISLCEEEKITFPEVVGRLHKANIESYYADLLKSTKTFYAKDEAHEVPFKSKYALHVGDRFDAASVIQAIKSIQAGKILYQEFLRQIRAAGVIAYLVFIDGRQVIYLGRRGELHIEPFPVVKS